MTGGRGAAGRGATTARAVAPKPTNLLPHALCLFQCTSAAAGGVVVGGGGEGPGIRQPPTHLASRAGAGRAPATCPPAPISAGAGARRASSRPTRCSTLLPRRLGVLAPARVGAARAPRSLMAQSPPARRTPMASASCSPHPQQHGGVAGRGVRTSCRASPALHGRRRRALARRHSRRAHARSAWCRRPPVKGEGTVRSQNICDSKQQLGAGRPPQGGEHGWVACARAARGWRCV